MSRITTCPGCGISLEDNPPIYVEKVERFTKVFFNEENQIELYGGELELGESSEFIGFFCPNCNSDLTDEIDIPEDDIIWKD